MELTCPRCHEAVQEDFYGPCAACRSALRASVRGEQRDVEVEAFNPAMHVTPNAVALKDE